MQISFSCKTCNTTIEADSELCGEQAQCPNCDSLILVPPPGVGPGTTLGGFKLGEKVGSGGMGEVYLATQLSVQRRVAVKVLPAALSNKRAEVERFFHEARMAARLEHPNIVTVHDAGDDFGVYYYAMSYVDGESLAERLDRDGAMPEKEALTTVRTVARALAFAWEKQHMLHRDIKPANIMIDADGTVKLLDLGLAKSVLEETGLTMTGTILGTPNYMSPEQALAKEDLDCRADIYSLGATLFHLVTGKPPYEGESVMSVLARLAHEEIPSPRSLNPEVSRPCARLIQLMTAKSREDRYPDYEALAADITRARQGDMPQAGDVTVLAPSVRPGGDPEVPPTPAAPASGGATAPSRPKRRVVKIVIAAAGVFLLFLLLLAALVSTDTSGPAGGVTTGDTRNGDGGAAANADALSAADTPPGADAGASGAGGARRSQDTNPAPAVAAEPTAVERSPRPRPGASTPPARPGGIKRPGKRRPKGDAGAATAATSAAAVLAGLEREARQLIKDGHSREAIRRLRGYEGPLAAETEDSRAQLAGDLIRQRFFGRGVKGGPLDFDATGADAGAEPAPTAPKSPSPPQPPVALDEIAAALLRQDFDPIRHRLTALPPAARKKAPPALSLVEQVLQGTTLIADSFRRDVGKAVKVRFRDGTTRELQIDAVAPDNDSVQAKKIIRDHGSVIRMRYHFRIRELSAAERASRLGREKTPERQLLRGILALEAGKPEISRKYFDSVGGALGQALIRQLAAATAAERSDQAEQSFTDLLRTAQVPASEDDPTRLTQLLYTRDYSRITQQRLNQMAQDFLHTYGASEPARRYAAFLSALTTLGSTRLPAGCQSAPNAAPPAPLAGLAAGSEEAQKRQTTLSARRGLPLEVTNFLAMRFRLIPPGRFRRDNGSEVVISHEFYLGTYEVTQLQWHSVMGTNPSPRQLEELPVENVSWNEAVQFAARLCTLAKVPPGTYRLPTEAEWEYACRAGTTGDFYFDATRGHLSRYGNYLDRSAPDRIGKLHLRLLKDHWHDDGAKWAVEGGRYRPNAWGLCDMYGNVFEWCRDWKGKYPSGRVVDPEGPPGGLFRVHRGGSYLYRAEQCSSSARHQSPPDYRGGQMLFGNALGVRLLLAP